MVIHFQKTLLESLNTIKFKEYHKFPINNQYELRTLKNSDKIVGKYGEAKWKVVELLNEKLRHNFNLHNWLNQNKKDEVAYFLNEAGSNCLNYSKGKILSAG